MLFSRAPSEATPIIKIFWVITHYNGEDVHRDYQNAFEWSCKSAEPRNAIARYTLDDGD